ncbi:MAG: M48 family metalloprotease [Methylophilaceae bacterium]|nr:M48 family metalloprotease [Methylophilaceae bacterium]
MRGLLLALLLVVSLPAMAFDLGKTLGGKSLKIGKTSKTEEIRIGREIAGNLLGAAPLVMDAELQKYVNRVGLWVALQSERPDLPWRFGVIDSSDLNAFAAPGGYVLITKGLYRTLNSEAELAGVLAHEIAHVVKKHHLKLLQKQQLLDAGAGLLGEQVGKDSDSVRKLIGSGAEICARSLDKGAEYEADRMGVILAARAGYDPYGLPEVLQAIGHAGRDDGRVALLFKTHPHPDDRLAKLGEAVGDRLDGVKDGKMLRERLYKMKE